MTCISSTNYNRAITCESLKRFAQTSIFAEFNSFDPILSTFNVKVKFDYAQLHIKSTILQLLGIFGDSNDLDGRGLLHTYKPIGDIPMMHITTKLELESNRNFRADNPFFLRF